MTQQPQPETQSPHAPGTLESAFPSLASLYSCQSTLPALVASEEDLWRAIAAPNATLDPGITIQLAYAAFRSQAEPESSSFGQAAVNLELAPAVETFATKLSSCPTSLSAHDIEWLAETGLASSALIEAVC